MQDNPYPLRIDRELMQKLKLVAGAHSRSVNKEIEFLIKQDIEAYEQAHGEIVVPKES